VNLLFLPSFVRNPAFLRRRDVLLLPFLRAAANQNHKALAILAEIDSVARAEIDLAFKNAGTDARYLREIALFHTRQRDGHFGGYRSVESFEPSGEPLVAGFVNVTAKLDHLGSW
jgi:hypothetical protein